MEVSSVIAMSSVNKTNHESNSWGRITAAAVAAASDIGSNAATVNRSVSNELVLGTQ